jgi:epoxyqueuosine reductase
VNLIDVKRRIISLSADVGFERCGICSAEIIGRGDYYRRWLSLGRAGTMDYLHRNQEQRIDASRLLPGAKSVIVCALNYHQPDPPPVDDTDANPKTDGVASGRVAMYAWGDDYHRIIKRKLFAIIDRLRTEVAEPFEAKACVDTAPILEREYAARAGVGWIGKNTLVLDPLLGSYFFLGLIVTTLELPTDTPSPDHCGTCTRCLQACPTDAFPAAYEMDASRCISYLTIEHRAETVPAKLQSQMGDWVFGCDVCQQVCPHNSDVPPTNEPKFAIRPPGPRPNLDAMRTMTDEDFREQLKGSAIKRAKPDMLRRNAHIALANLKAWRTGGSSSMS